MAISAGLCMWRQRAGHVEVLIVHPGGPYWATKDDGAWSFPKGEYDPATEDGLTAARREFEEELGTAAPTAKYVSLGETRLKSGKTVQAWAVEGDLEADAIVSNSFEIEWPPRSGHLREFPEVDRALWADQATASVKLNPAQTVFLDRLGDALAI